MLESNPGRDWVEVLVAIGRIEEGIKGLRETVDRLDRKSSSQDEDIQEIQLQIQNLETQRSTFKENLALFISLVAVSTALIGVLVF